MSAENHEQGDDRGKNTSTSVCSDEQIKNLEERVALGISSLAELMHTLCLYQVHLAELDAKKQQGHHLSSDEMLEHGALQKAIEMMRQAVTDSDIQAKISQGCTELLQGVLRDGGGFNAPSSDKR